MRTACGLLVSCSFRAVLTTQESEILILPVNASGSQVVIVIVIAVVSVSAACTRSLSGGTN